MCNTTRSMPSYPVVMWSSGSERTGGPCRTPSAAGPRSLEWLGCVTVDPLLVGVVAASLDLCGAATSLPARRFWGPCDPVQCGAPRLHGRDDRPALREHPGQA